MQKKSTILILGKLPPPYMGPAIATKILLDSSLKNDFNVVHLNTKINESVADMGKWNFSKMFASISLYLNYRKILRSKNVNLVLIPISQTTLGFIKDAPFMWIAKLYGTKNIIQLRGSNFKNWLDKSSSLTKLFVKASLKKANGVIVLGESLKYLFTPFFKNDNIHVIPNGENFSFPEKKSNDKINILYLANFLPSKGFKEFLEALNPISNPNVELIAAGSWDNKEYEDTCKKLINEQSIKITLLPPTSGIEKLSLFANADIFVFAPIGPEGHPWVVVEAMAAGLPIISADQGAIKESVINNENGYIIDPKNTKLFTEKLNALIESDTLRKEMSKRSHDFYMQKFTREIMVEQYKKVFSYYCN